MKNNKCVTISIVLTLIVCTTALAQHNTESKDLSAKQWREDLRYLAEQMPRVHKSAFHTITKEQFDAAVLRLDGRIPSLKRHEIIIELSRLVAMIGDGHTELWLGHDAIGFRQYPLRVYLFEDDLYLQAAESRYADFVGKQVVRIGNCSATEALKKVGKVLARDNEMYLKAYTPRYLIVPEVLNALGIIDDMNKADYTIRDKTGKLVKLPVSPEKTNHDLNTWAVEAPQETFSDKFVNARNFDKNTPLYLENPQDTFWSEYLADLKTLYVQINTIRNKPDETMEAFAAKVFQTVDEKDVEKFVLDIRQNGGGNNRLNEPWMQGIIKRDKINQHGSLFVIIGRHTFSAASHLVTLLERHTKALFVGEPTGASPNHYGDVDRLTLPNSKIRVHASTLYWQNSVPSDSRRWTSPQIATRLTFDDYINNRDSAMEAILNYKPGQSFPEIVSEFVKDKDLAEFMRKYRAFKSNPSHIYVDTESDVNRLGYQLMGNDQLDSAIEIFILNVESYQDSANAYDSLADAHTNRGNKKLAIEYYKKSLELNQENQNARNRIKELQSDK